MPHLESKIEDSCTKSNEHEATFFARFAKYLIQQGYTSEQITVLTAYSGQVQLLRREFRAMDLSGIRITSVDNFQVHRKYRITQHREKRMI